jgi:hypothetical protein
MKSRKSQFKPLLLTTTLRNPQRIKDFLYVILEFKNVKLTNDVINKIVLNLVKRRIYSPVFINRSPFFLSKLKNEIDFTDEEAKTIIENSPQNHKEAGFDKGWPSRFDTWYKFLKELGFIFYEMNEPILISKTAEMLASSNEKNTIIEQQIFLNAFAKYQRINPYRKILNDNIPLSLLLKTAIYLKNHYEKKYNGISIKEVPLLLCWKDNNHEELAKEIIDLRSKFGSSPSNEIIYDYCKKIMDIDEKEENRFKISNITQEMPDDFIRKVRLTGLIAIRGLGRYIDLNNNELEKIEYIIKTYSKPTLFADTIQYYNYMSSIDKNIISDSIERSEQQFEFNLFEKWIEIFDFETILFELDILSSSKKHSKHELLKFIDEPLRLEFLTALSIKKAYPNYDVKPNYISDDEGVPTRFAGGGKPDIICYDEKGTILVEVTMLTGTQQNIREMPSIFRHLKEYLVKDKNSQSIMIAPSIHEDTSDYSVFLKNKYDVIINTIDISKLIEILNNKKILRL